MNNINTLSLNDSNLSTTISNLPEIRQLQLDHLTFEFDFRKATALHKSGIYSNRFKNEYEIFTILQEGRTLGFNSSEAMNGLYLVGGGVQMYGSLKTAYLQKRGYKIQFNNEKVTNNRLVETTVIVTKDDEKYETTVTVEQIKSGALNAGLKNAPMTKLRYEAINRILKTQLAGAIPEIVARSEDDIINLESVKKIEESKPDALIDYIENDCKSLEQLLKVEAQLKTDEQKKSFEQKKKEFNIQVKAVEEDILPSKVEPKEEIDNVIDTDLITDAQVKLISVLCSKHPNPDRKDSIKNLYGVSTTKHLSKKQAKEIIDDLNNEIEEFRDEISDADLMGLNYN